MTGLFVYVASPQEEGWETEEAAVCLHAVCNTEAEARDVIRDRLREEPDIQAYVVDEPRRWLPVLEPTDDARVT